MARPNFIQRIVTWCKRWHALFATIYYLIGILANLSILFAIPTFIVTIIVNFYNKSQKDLRNFSEPFGKLLSSETYSLLLYYRWEIIFVCWMLFGIYGFLVYTKLRQRLYSTSTIDDVAREYCSFLTELRSFTLISLGDGKMPADEYEQYLHKMYADIEKFFVKSANKISLLFGNYTNYSCHVSIKLFRADNGLIKTVARDEISLDNRGSIDENLKWYD